MIKRILKLNILLLLLAVLVSASCQGSKRISIEPATINRRIFDDNILAEKDLEHFAKLVEHIWHNGKIVDYNLAGRFSDTPQTIYIALRSKGLRLIDTWQTDMSLSETLVRAVNNAKQTLNAEQIDNIDTLEIDLCHSFRELYTSNDRQQSLTNIHRGIRGYELSYGSKIERAAPTYAIATNRSNQRLLELFQEKYKLTDAQMQNEVRYRTFEGVQVLVYLGKTKAVLTDRGNTFVPLSEVTQENTRKTAETAIKWMFNNVHQDGRFTYKYWPSVGAESQTKNMIRLWMATTALGKVAAKSNDPKLWNIIERNIDYNLQQFYREEGQYGLIEWEGKVKLGALSIATMAIVEHPKRSKWARQEAAIRRTIDSLWKSDGSFNTFYKPKDRNDNQNFYPGEALLLWSILYEEKRDEKLLQRFMKSFEYYSKWHLGTNRNPAFIPWHTQAYYTVWKQTRNERLRKFIFQMNDWLLSVQQLEDNVVYRDTAGRFYDPTRPFGPPHSSSTGVYLEGLIDAFQLARQTGDNKRTNAYRIAILRGLRSVMQLQFTDDIDMFYISESKRKYARGGIRTTVYDNQIRCDNVQHNLMAILKILDAFEQDDYKGI
ncbi:MAG: hypothetical protein H8D56_14785 [Planctomycetes bacterium]|nr:hypothetical protein [Planctomycetota bacterium]MBL7143539.1 hypothetical protein [Phycisphaerae bacterium]